MSRYARAIMKVRKPEAPPPAAAVSVSEPRRTRLDMKSMMDIGKSVLDMSKLARSKVDQVVKSLVQIR